MKLYINIYFWDREDAVAKWNLEKENGVLGWVGGVVKEISEMGPARQRTAESAGVSLKE